MIDRLKTRVRAGRHSDVTTVVAIHVETFPGFFLTSLGRRFLAAFYRGLVDCPLGILLVAETDNGVVGFVGGATDESALFAWLKRERRLQFIREAALAAIRRPGVIRRLLRARQRDADSAESYYPAVLLSIGVLPEFKGRGVGKELVQEFEQTLSDRGVAGYCLTTDADQNEGTNAFYRSLGLARVRSFTTPEGRAMNEYASNHLAEATGRVGPVERQGHPRRPAESRAARIAFLGQYFPPEVGAPQTSFDIANVLREIGYGVQVITALPNYPTGRIFEGYPRSAPCREEVRGIPTLRAPLYPNHGSSPIGRAANYLSFAASAAFVGRRYLATSDLNFIISSPATLDAVGLAYLIRRNRPYVLFVQDLWPDTLFATDFVNRESGAGNLVDATLGRYCRSTMRHASAVIAITQSMREAIVDRGIPAEKVHTVYNWAQETEYYPRHTSPTLRQRLNLTPSDTVFMFSGNLGPAQDLTHWISAFAEGTLPSSAHLVLQGDGSEKARLQARAAGCERIHFLPRQPTLQDAIAYESGADCLVVSLADDPLFRLTMPSKVANYLASGKAVAATVAGEAATVLRESGAGIVGAPGDVEAVCSVVSQSLEEGRGRLQNRGDSGRRYYESRLSRDHSRETLGAIVDGILRRGPFAERRRVPV